MWSPRLFLAVALFGGSTRPLLADVLVVDASGAGDFTDLQPAVDFAADGDTLLVKTGTYGHFRLDAKGLVVLAEAGATVTIQELVTDTSISNLGKGQMVLLSGLVFRGLGEHADGLCLWRNTGPVRVQSCTLLGGDALEYPEGDGGNGAYVCECPDVAFTDCTIRGGHGSDDGDDPCFGCQLGSGGYGMWMDRSTVTVNRCTITGGDGGSSPSWGGDGGDGGHGAALDNSNYVAVDSRFQGGDGGDSSDVFPVCGRGGAGLWVEPTSVVHELACSFAGGKAGSTFGGECADGQDVVGSVTSLSGPARAMLTERVVREGQTYDLAFHGAPRDAVYLASSPATLYRFLPSLRGVHLLAPIQPSSRARTGTIPGSGAFSITVTQPDLRPGEQSRIVHTQAIFVDRLGAPIVTNLQSLVVLDSGF